MPIRLSCPRCQKPMQVDDRFAGMAVKCPGCATVVNAPARTNAQQIAATSPGAAPADQFDFYGAPSAPTGTDAVIPQRGPEAAGWRSMVAGLHLIWLGSGIQALAVTVVWLVASIIFGAGAQMLSKAEEGEAAPVARPEANAAAALIIQVIVLTTLAAGTLLRLTGFVRTLGAPPESGAKGLAIGMLCAEVLLLMSLAASVAGALLGALLVAGGANLLALIAFLAGLVLQLVFVRRVGVAVNSKKLREKLRNFLFWLGGGILAVALVVVGFVALTAFLGIDPTARVLGSIPCIGTLMIIVVVVGVGLTVLVKYLGLLGLASDEIRKRLR